MLRIPAGFCLFACCTALVQSSSPENVPFPNCKVFMARGRCFSRWFVRSCNLKHRLPCVAGGENGFNQAIELSAGALANVKFVQVRMTRGTDRPDIAGSHVLFTRLLLHKGAFVEQRACRVLPLPLQQKCFGHAVGALARDWYALQRAAATLSSCPSAA